MRDSLPEMFFRDDQMLSNDTFFDIWDREVEISYLTTIPATCPGSVTVRLRRSITNFAGRGAAGQRLAAHYGSTRLEPVDLPVPLDADVLCDFLDQVERPDQGEFVTSLIPHTEDRDDEVVVAFSPFVNLGGDFSNEAYQETRAALQSILAEGNQWQIVEDVYVVSYSCRWEPQAASDIVQPILGRVHPKAVLIATCSIRDGGDRAFRLIFYPQDEEPVNDAYTEATDGTWFINGWRGSARFYTTAIFKGPIGELLEDLTSRLIENPLLLGRVIMFPANVDQTVYLFSMDMPDEIKCP